MWFKIHTIHKTLSTNNLFIIKCLRSCKNWKTSRCSQVTPLPYFRVRMIRHLYEFWTRTFFNCGVLEPRSSIVHIIAYALQLRDISDVYKKFSMTLCENEVQYIQDLCQLRLKRLPVQYITGQWQFRDLVLKMKAPVFIPRPETEDLVNIVANYLEKNEHLHKILELGCGSGAISLSLLKSNSNINIIALDRSFDACDLTIENAVSYDLNRRLDVFQYTVSENHLLQELTNKFDVIVTNPPYVPTKQVKLVKPEIKLYEDLKALDGGSDGLSLIQSILLLAKEKLVIGGKLFMETDSSHPLILKRVAERYPALELKFVTSYKDFCNTERFVEFEKI